MTKLWLLGWVSSFIKTTKDVIHSDKGDIDKEDNNDKITIVIL